MRDIFLTIFFVLLYIVVPVGYVLNIVKLVSAAMHGSSFELMEILRIAGLFTPIGPLVGYF